MTDRDSFDIDDAMPEPENVPGHIVNPDAWQARPSAGSGLMVVLAVLMVAACFVAAVMGGWR